MSKSLLQENVQLTRAVQLIRLGARMAVLETETGLSHERLVRLYREVTGKSPSRGQLPYSTDWYTSWQPNIHASLFMNLYENINKASALEPADLLIKAWQLYAEDVAAMDAEPILTITRAWRLVKFVDSDMLCLTPCTHCGGQFVTHPHEWNQGNRRFVCGLCEPPARAGKSRRRGSIH